MVFPILGGNSAVAGYSIDNSLRFNDDDSAYLSQTASTPTIQHTGTLSFWMKLGNIGVSNEKLYHTTGGSDSNTFTLQFQGTSHRLMIANNGGILLMLNRLLRDASAYYHIVCVSDPSNATASQRLRIYINGVEETSMATDNRSSVGTSSVGISVNSQARYISGNGSQDYFDGYMAEYHFIDGQALSPTDFAEVDEDSGIWKPKKFEGTYGTNGFKLDFSDSGSLGADSSPNGNNFTPTNLASTDQTTDTPTNNWCTPNTLDKGTTYPLTLAEGNLKIIGASEANSIRSTMMMTSGKWYWECRLVTAGTYNAIGIASSTSSTLNTLLGSDSESIGYFSHTGLTQKGGTATTSGATWSTTGDIMGIAFDADNGDLTFYKNNSSQPNSYSGLTEGYWMPSFTSRGGAIIINFGQDGSFAGTETAQGNTDANGYGDFYYSPPSGYLALCTQNLATALSPTIDDGSQYFNTVLYTGNGSTQSITGVGFQPDWTWIKERSSTSGHEVFDSTRGATKLLSPNTSDAEGTNASALTSFDSDGFSVGSGGAVNENTQTYVGWNWLANGGTTLSNTDGSITSTVQANTTAGFSIVTYTGTGSAGTIGHGLGKTPKMIIVKNRDGAYQWLTYHAGMTNAETSYIELNSTVAQQSGETHWNSTAPTSSVFSCLTQLSINNSGDNYVAYCFADIEGYSKFGSYTGNGSTDGTFVYTGFRPAWVIIKRTDSAGNDWIMIDTKRFTYNQISSYIRANTSDAETDQFNIDEDIVSNGFKIRGDSGNINASGGTYIYMCFASNPFVSSSGVPVVAR